MQKLACSQGISTRTESGYLFSADCRVVYALDSRSLRVGRDAAVEVALPCPSYHASNREKVGADNGLLLRENPLLPSTPLQGKSIAAGFSIKLTLLA